MAKWVDGLLRTGSLVDLTFVLDFGHVRIVIAKFPSRSFKYTPVACSLCRYNLLTLHWLRSFSPLLASIVVNSLLPL